MISLKISNQIEMNRDGLSVDLLETIKKDLMLDNPEFMQAVRLGRSTHGKPEKITLYRIEDNSVILPRGYGKKLMQRLEKAGTPFKYEEQRLTLPGVNFGSTIKLRDYQDEAVKELVKHKQGGVVAGCGAGKTMIMLEAMARIGQPSLWITHTHELLEQVIDRACSVFDIDRDEIGVIGGGKHTIGTRLTVALVQTLSKADLDEIKYKFGAIFIDEAHHLAAKTFYHPIGQFPALYRIWASATPDRSDGLTKMVFAGSGPILYTVDQSKVPTITPQLEVIETNFTSQQDEYVWLISELINDHKRNDMLVRVIASQARGNYSLVLSDRVEHCEILQTLLKKALPDLKIRILTGSMKKKERAEVMEQVQQRKVHIILATQLAREGLDITHLNRLFLCTPKKAAGAVQQEVGRIMRPCEGKTDAIVYDFWDNQNPILKSQFWKRREVYKKIGMDWQPQKQRGTM